VTALESPPPLDPPVVGATQAPWQPRVRALLEVLACSSAPTQMLISGVLLVAGMPSTDESGTLSLPFVVTVSLVDSAVLIALMVTITRAHGERPSDLWLGHTPALPEVWRGLALVPLIIIAVMSLLLTLRSVAPWLHNVPSNPLEAFARGSTMDAVALGMVVIVAGGVREELQRAFLLRRFEQHLGGAWVGVVVTSVAFGAGHALQGWDAAVVTGALGALWAVLYLRRRSSIAPMVSHAGFNSLEVLRVALGTAGG
jgi:uncharacterized protein